jgi:hypothetical protein
MSNKMIEVEVRSAFMLNGKIARAGSLSKPNVITVSEKEARKLLHRGKVVLAEGADPIDEDAVEPAKKPTKKPAKKPAAETGGEASGESSKGSDAGGEGVNF